MGKKKLKKTKQTERYINRIIFACNTARISFKKLILFRKAKRKMKIIKRLVVNVI